MDVSVPGEYCYCTRGNGQSAPFSYLHPELLYSARSSRWQLPVLLGSSDSAVAGDPIGQAQDAPLRYSTLLPLAATTITPSRPSVSIVQVRFLAV